VMLDTLGRRRLVIADAMPVGALRQILTFLEDKRDGFRSNTPKFQTGVLTLGQLQVVSPFEMATVYNEAQGSIAGQKLIIRHRVDNGAWEDDDIALDGPLTPTAYPPRTSRVDLAANEGRILDVIVGENPNDLTEKEKQTTGVVVEEILFDSNVIGPRRGYHTGGA